MFERKKLIVLILSFVFTVFVVSLLGIFIADFGDPIGQTIPNKFLVIESLKNGILPFWNPYNFLGFPLLADIQAGVFYIPDLIFFAFFEPLMAYNISIIFHLFVAGAGFYVFSFGKTKSNLIAIALAAMMVFTGSFLSRIVYLNFLETIAYIPWVLVLFDRDKISIPILTLIFSGMILAGHPIAFVYSAMIVFSYLLFNNYKKFGKVCLALLLSLGVSAVQLIPFANLKSNSVRDVISYDQFVEGSLSFYHIFEFLDPFINGFSYKPDFFVHFGLVAFISCLVSLIFWWKFSNDLKLMYLLGCFLGLTGLILGLGENTFVSHLVYNIPVLNLIRVPARYIILLHFGVFFVLLSFLSYLLNNYKKLGVVLSVLILLNSIFIPFYVLDKRFIDEGVAHYTPYLNEIMEIGVSELGIDSVPRYFYAHEYFLYPNRHIVNYMSSISGYNPMVLKNYYEKLPVFSDGSFRNPRLVVENYELLKNLGLEFYIFPSEELIVKDNLVGMEDISRLLSLKNWEKVEEIDRYQIWKNNAAMPFAYFENSENKIESIDFKPGEILLNVDVKESDRLIINQSYYDGWKMTIGDSVVESDKYIDLVQMYEVPSGSNVLMVKFMPRGVFTGALISLLSLIICLILYLKEKKFKFSYN